VSKSQGVHATDPSENEVRDCLQRSSAPRAHAHTRRRQICTIICARLDSTALGALLNVVLFSIRLLIQTVLYRGQLLVVSTKPKISFRLKLREAPAELQDAAPDSNPPAALAPSSSV
jgi:hypothetical protein